MKKTYLCSTHAKQQLRVIVGLMEYDVLHHVEIDECKDEKPTCEILVRGSECGKPSRIRLIDGPVGAQDQAAWIRRRRLR